MPHVDREKTRSQPFAANGFYTAVVSRVDGENVYVTVPRLTSTLEYGPLYYLGGLPEVGDRLLVGFMEGRVDELVGLSGVSNPNSVLAWSFSGAADIHEGLHLLPMPFACTINTVEVTAGSPPTGSSLIIDMNKNDVTVFTDQDNRPTIAVDGTTSGLCVPDVVDVVVGDILTIDIDQIGSGEPGCNLTVVVWITA